MKYRIGITLLLLISALLPIQAETQYAVQDGKAASARFRGKAWKQTSNGLRGGGGAGRALVTKQKLGTGDAEITIQMSLEKPNGTGASVELAGGRFGLDGRGKKFFTESGGFGGLKLLGTNVNHIQPDIPVTLVITRQKDQLNFSIDGNAIHTHTLATNIPLGTIGLRPHRGTITVKEFSITGEFAELPPAAKLKPPVLPRVMPASKSLEGSIDPYLGDAALEMYQVFSNERFPNIVITMKGTVLVTWGSTHTRARRSEDGGKTWGPEISIGYGMTGGGTTVDEATGDILAFVEDEHPPAPLTVYRSQDDGKTWIADPVNMPKESNGNEVSMCMNDHGITLRHGKYKGRLLRPSRYYGEGNRPVSLFPTHYTNAVYSDDGGKNWSISAPFSESGTGEACVVELSDGRIYYNSRRHWAPKHEDTLRRWDCYSSDGGATWTPAEICEPLPDGPQNTSYGCMGGLCRLPIAGRDILIYSNCDSPGGRHHGTVWASFDGGQTWPLKRLVYEGRFAYSAMIAGRPGTSSDGWIYVHFEGGPKGSATVARFNLEWLLKGEQTGDGDMPDWIKN